MKDMYLDNVEEWIEQERYSWDIKGGVCAHARPFGFITLKDGSKVEVQIRLEKDQDDWITNV